MAGAPSGTVTLMFTDIERSTRLLQRVGGAYADLLADHRGLLRDAFEQHGGYEVDAEGDSFFVAFASANDAVAAAVRAQRALAEHSWPESGEIHVRMGLHTGEPRLIDGRYVGLDVHAAARVMAAGHGGQVLVSESTRRLLDERFELRDLGEHRLKDLSGPQCLYQVVAEGLALEFPPLQTLENRPTNLPVQPTRLIGREHELAELEALLAKETRLLTLTGPGGTGKTRLALQVAANAIEAFPSGVFFVPLASIRDVDLVLPTIAQTLGLREQPGQAVVETLKEYLDDKQLLLVLDNFEQVVAAAPSLAVVLSSATGLCLLVTSRTPLHLSGEVTYAVPPLALPEAGEPAGAEVLLQNESVSLFVERARAASRDFAITDANAHVVAEICVRLEGLPLAIELAAPRVRVLEPPALLRRLDQRLKLLTSGPADLHDRQRTLRATIDWSYDLLSDEEKQVFVRLGVFVEGCRVDAGEALWETGRAPTTDLLEAFASLVEKSLLRQRPGPDGEPRFWMFETVREYALESLQATGELDTVRRLHARFFLSLAEQADVESRTGDHTGAFTRLDLENGNLRAAIAFAREAGDGELMLCLATALWSFWATRGYVAEGRSALGEAMASAAYPPPRAMLGACTLDLLGGRGVGLEEVRAVIEACERLGDDFSLAQAWNLLGRVQGSVLGAMGAAEAAWRNALSYAERGDFAAEKAEAIGWLMISAIFGPLPVEEGIARCQEFAETAGDDPAVAAFCSVERAVLEAMRGEFELARRLLSDGTRAVEELGLSVWAANNAQETFFVEMLAGNPPAASAVLRRSYSTLEQMGERGFLSTIAGFLAHALYAQGEYEEAERFSRASEEAAATDDVQSQVLWRTARAKVCARRGEGQHAESIAREALQLADRTDLVNTQADVLLDLAEVLRLAGRVDEALAAAEESERRYREKGNLSSLARAHQTAAELRSAPAPP
jgi:predicted ATPase/class 3 adenylate cyclase